MFEKILKTIIRSILTLVMHLFALILILSMSIISFVLAVPFWAFDKEERGFCFHFKHAIDNLETNEHP